MRCFEGESTLGLEYACAPWFDRKQIITIQAEDLCYDLVWQKDIRCHNEVTQSMDIWCWIFATN